MSPTLPSPFSPQYSLLPPSPFSHDVLDKEDVTDLIEDERFGRCRGLRLAEGKLEAETEAGSFGW